MRQNESLTAKTLFSENSKGVFGYVQLELY